MLLIFFLNYHNLSKDFFSVDNIQVRKKRKFDIEQTVEIPHVPQFLIQIKASNVDVNDRIEKFMERKRKDIDLSNISEFCCGDRNSEFICARIDASVQKRKDSKSHLQGKMFFLSFDTE